MAVSGNPLIEDDIEAWEFGPVIPKLYHALRDYGDGNIPRLIRWGDDTPFASNQGDTARADLDKREREAIEKVWNTYENFHAFQLSALTHAPDSPWSKTYEPRKNRVIDNYMILDYFADLAASA